MKSNTKNFIVLGIYQEKSVYYNNENHQLLYPTKDKTIGATAITGYSSIALILYSVLRSISKMGKYQQIFGCFLWSLLILSLVLVAVYSFIMF